MEPITRIQVFTTVVDQGSFSAAATQLGITKSAVSKHVQALEDHLGARLMNRTTRTLNLTEAGNEYYCRCTTILEALEEAERSVHNLQTNPRGTLRINAPVSFGLSHLSEALAEFAAEYPDINVDVEFNDRFINIIEEGFDVVVRIARLPDSSLIARKLAPCHIVLCASPEYLKTHGTPTTPDQLRKHKFVEYAYRPLSGAMSYESKRGKEHIAYEVAFRANNGHAIMQAAIKGVGIVSAPTFIVWKALQNNELVMLPEQVQLEPSRHIYAVYPHNRQLSAKVRVFIDFLVKRFGNNPYWDEQLTLPQQAA